MSQIADQDRRYIFKVVIVGDGGVGKSTLLQRLLTGKYLPMKLTVGTDLATKELDINSKRIKLQVWDFAGEKRFRFFLPNYARGARGCLICYDVTRYTSFQNLPEWYNIVSQSAVNPIFILVGCKQDLGEMKRTVTKEEAEKFREKYSIPYFFETSSKTGFNNELIFDKLSRELFEMINNK